jgi:peptide chain release factor subunit 1
MIVDKEIQSLVEFRGNNRVLSLYLNTDLAHKSRDAIKLMLRERLHSLEEKPAAEDVRAIERFLDFEYDWQSRGIAIFSAGDELWKTIPLPVAVSTQAYYAEKPYVNVLTDVLDRLGRYVVALIDRQSVRLFSMAWGRIQAETETSGEEIKHHKQGGWAAARFQRHESNLALHNLKQAVEIIQEFCQAEFPPETGHPRLILAGSSEVLTQVKEMLPKALRSQVIGEFSADMESISNEILNRSLDILAQADLEEERKVVTDVITAAAKGGAGVIGLADTLYVLHQGRVRHLLVEEDFRASGFACASCGYIAAEHSVKCPFCGHEELTAVPDAVNRAIHKAVQTGADVNIVRQNEDLIQAGSIAAALRY